MPESRRWWSSVKRGTKHRSPEDPRPSLSCSGGQSRLPPPSGFPGPLRWRVPPALTGSCPPGGWQPTDRYRRADWQTWDGERRCTRGETRPGASGGGSPGTRVWGDSYATKKDLEEKIRSELELARRRRRWRVKSNKWTRSIPPGVIQGPMGSPAQRLTYARCVMVPPFKMSMYCFLWPLVHCVCVCVCVCVSVSVCVPEMSIFSMLSRNWTIRCSSVG